MAKTRHIRLTHHNDGDSHHGGNKSSQEDTTLAARGRALGRRGRAEVFEGVVRTGIKARIRFACFSLVY